MHNRDNHCSVNQIGLLRHIDTHFVSESRLRRVNQTTLWSVLYRRYVVRTGPNPNDPLELNEDGRRVLSAYNSRQAPIRAHVGDLTERTSKLLHKAKIRLQRNGHKGVAA